MKNRYVAVILGMMLAVSPCTAMATETSAAVENTEEQNMEINDEAVYGQVISVQEDSITVAIGTRKEMLGDAPEKLEDEEGQPDEMPSEYQPDENGGEITLGEKLGEPSGQPSMLDLTGEEMTITITEDTVITRGSMGSQMGENGIDQPGEKPDAVPEKPEGEDGQTADPDVIADDINQNLTLIDIEEDDIVSIILDEDNNAVSVTVMSFGIMGGPGMHGSEPGGNSQPENYTAVNEYSEDDTMEGESISSTGADENAVLVGNGANVTLSGALH